MNSREPGRSRNSEQDPENPSGSDVGVMIKGKVYPYVEKNPLDAIALNGFNLGIAVGLAMGLLTYTFFKNFNVYVLAISIFHFLEFFVTARFNPGKVTSDSFLFNNGKAYIFSHLFAMTEALVQCLFFPRWKSSFYSKAHLIISLLGFLLIIMGQYVRTMAMVTAGKSFSHHVKQTRNSDHVLVTTGIYGWFRHPSYFGYFWWALGTQLWLLNPLSFVMFAVVLWRFFDARIEYEERYLVAFFGLSYKDYTTKVGTGIPFVHSNSKPSSHLR
ncbi:LADA_0G13718g1_1 [Lachancea dasiensis]|uniref:Protein-S-isoprenylcysteine O-methyltransferase n=1 Tax=Lachancea dasiensis TaxID=1072105 RepID=A0A1G4JVS2_9SACH|nr:LADA_0G13718g1_1 [Lachancea dasiensis]